MVVRVQYQTAMRAGAVTLLEAYAADAMTRLQVYPGRPRSIYPPTAFIDAINETLSYTGLRQRSPQAEVVVIHGLFDTKEAADQRDAFVDGFIDWVTDNPDASGAGNLIWVPEVTDLPTFVPDWVPPEDQKAYYATRIVLEGLSLGAN